MMFVARGVRHEELSECNGFTFCLPAIPHKHAEARP